MDNAPDEDVRAARRRKAARPWMIALIPAGFVLFVVVLVWLGQPTGGPTEMPEFDVLIDAPSE